MGKRPAEALVNEADPLKRGERPFKAENGNEEGEFEDEFEDEFESEDEIFEAGVDGQPDEEREAEGSRGMWITPGILCERTRSTSKITAADSIQMQWMSTSGLSYRDVTRLQLENH